MRRLLLVSLLLGCAEAVPRAEVPEAPIAFVRQQASEGIIGLDEFREALRIGPVDASKYHRRKTTLSLLSVPSGEIRAVPDAGFGSLPMDWSSDGHRLLIGRRDRDGLLSLHTWNKLTNAWSRPAHRFSQSLAALGDGPIRLAWSGQWPSQGGPDLTGVWVDLGHLGRLPLPLGEGAVDPDVSPDGRTVIFTTPPPRPNRDGLILIADVADRERRVLTRGSHARFSRDGEWIAFERQRETRDVWLMRSDGTAKRPIATSSFDEEYPAVSPAGRYVVFASVRETENASQLYLVRVADGRQIQLTHTGQNSLPVW